MLSDQTLSYALRAGVVDPTLVELARIDKRKCDEVTAANAYAAFLDAAERGSPYAMCMCSRFSMTGWGRRRSESDAFKWARQAASMDFAPGHFELGRCYEVGIGVPPDFSAALSQYESALQGGFGFAGYHLATIYHAGRFGERDVAKAISFAIRGDEYGDPLAPYLIANWYEFGDGVPQNSIEALAWYKRAAKTGNFLASHRLSRAYAEGELGVSKDQSLSLKYLAEVDSQTG